jgi:hypothetical protein
MKYLWFLLNGILFSLPWLGFAQSNTGMLLSQIDGNRYLRKNYDKNAKLKSYQTIEVGSLEVGLEKIEAKLTVITYDSDDNLKAAAQTIVSCSPTEGQVIMGIFPFAGGPANKSLNVEMPKSKKLYPAGWKEKDSLEDFKFQLKFQKGAAGFLGTESQVSFVGRKVRPISDNLFRISGKMLVEAYILGIRLSSFKYDYSEEIADGIGIVREKFTESNGNYFTIERIEK